MKDYKLDGGGETGQLTSLRAPCSYLPKFTYCTVALHEQDRNRQVDNSYAQWLMKACKGRIDASFDFVLLNTTAPI